MSSIPIWAQELALELSRTIKVDVGNMLNARIEALSDRLLPEKRLRPPLAGDRMAKAVESVTAPMPAAEPSGSVTVTSQKPSNSPIPEVDRAKKEKKGNGKKLPNKEGKAQPIPATEPQRAPAVA